MKKLKANQLVILVPLLTIGTLIYFSFNRAKSGFQKADEVIKAGDKYLSKLCTIIDGSVYDGDTLRVSCDGVESKIRLCGIDAPEMNQPLGIESRNYLRSLINQYGSEVAIIPVENDRYNRTVAELVLSPGSTPEVSVQEQMLMTGMAYHYRQYSKNCPNVSVFDELEATAQEQKLGVWKNPNAVPPWEWRKNN